MLKYFVGDKPIRLMTNNPKKINDLAEHGVTNVTPIKHVAGVTDSNRNYLEAKRGWGHKLEQGDFADSPDADD